MAKKESKNENKVKKHFLKDFKAELKKVIWPTPKQLVNNTIAVVTIVLITSVIVFALDGLFRLGNNYGITKLQSIVDEKFNNEEEHDHENESGNEENTTSVQDTVEGENSSSSEEENTTTDNNGDATTETTAENTAE